MAAVRTSMIIFFFFQAEDGIRDLTVTGVQTCALPISSPAAQSAEATQAPETMVLKAAHLFDSTGTALKDGAIVVVRGDRIVSVGTAEIGRASCRERV